MKEIIYPDAKRIFVKRYNGDDFPNFPRYMWDRSSPDESSWKNNCGAVGNPPEYCYLSGLGVADLNCDGKPDIFGQALNEYRDIANPDSNPYAIFAFDGNGKTLKGYPFPLRAHQQYPDNLWSGVSRYQPTVGDVNGDGQTELAASNGGGKLQIISLNVPYDGPNKPFKQYGFDGQNTKSVI